MNRDIIELREVVQKLVPLLAGKGLVVTQRGSQAYVKTNPRTRKPEVVNIPNISDNAKPDFIEAIQGFIDHEVGHVLHTDWNYYGRAPSIEELQKTSVQQFLNSHNIVEDVMIEREMGKTFPGSKGNISRTRRYFLARVTEPAVKAATNEKEAFIYLVVPTMRALGGHVEMQEWMDAGGYWSNTYVDALVKSLKPETIDLLKTCSTTKETLGIAEEMHLILYPPAPPAPPAPEPEEEETAPPPSAPKPKKEPEEEEETTPSKKSDPDPEVEPEPDEDAEPDEDSSEEDDSEDDPEGEDEEISEIKSEDKPDEEAGEGDGDGERDHKDSPEPDEDDTGAGDLDDGEDGDDDDMDSSSGAPAGPSSDDGDDEDEGADEGGVAGDGGKSPFRTEGAEGGGVGDIAEGDENPGGGGGGVGNQAAKSLFDFQDDAFDKADMASQIGILISDEAVMAMDPKQYLVFTREMDRIEPVVVPENMNKSWVSAMEDEVRLSTAKMRKDVERIMASQSHVIRTPGHKRGKLHSPSLYRVLQGDPRVFSVKEEHVSKDTAVCLLADNSGSMWGEKMKLAMIASYALSVTLDAVKIPHEVLGFTSGDYRDIPYTMREAMEKDIEASGIKYDRIEPIMIPIYKSFAERLDATVKRRFAYMMNAQNGLNGNIDGESLEYAAERLIRRSEKRKVMIVLSDGQPAGSNKSGPHLTYVTRQLEKMGIECVGIGIMDSSVKKYYKKWVVLNNAEDLPNQVMREIKAILA